MTTSTAAPSAELTLEDEGDLRSPRETGDEQPKSSLRSLRIANWFVLMLLLAAPAAMCVRAASVADPDLWWHLRTGQWILEHHAIPRTDPFSSVVGGKPWQAYSWLFEFISIRLFAHFQLAGVVAYTAAMVLAITAALRHLLQRLHADSSVAALLTLAVCFSLGHLYTPRPWLVTILFFVLELDILMQARRNGRTRQLLWLPVIFALWSNLHIQFIDGLAVLALAAFEAIATRWLGVKTQLRSGQVCVALAASVAATFANPYGWHIYRVAYDLASQPGVLNKINELQAIPFRDSADYCLLLLALSASAALAWRRRLVLFEIGLLLFAAVVSFRSQRDVWVMAIAAATILATLPMAKNRRAITLPRFAPWLAAAGAALIVLIGFRVFKVNEANLERKVAETLPVAAAANIQAHHYPGPVYNDFTWGGYLIWSLQMPVSLDGRAALYGDKIIDRSVSTWNGEPDWHSDPTLGAAGVVVGPTKDALIQLLRTDPRFHLAYQDKLATVYVANR